MPKTVILPNIEIVESWDVDPDKNSKEYLKPDSGRYVAVTRKYTGTEFVSYFTEGRKCGFLLKLWRWINKL